MAVDEGLAAVPEIVYRQGAEALHVPGVKPLIHGGQFLGAEINLAQAQGIDGELPGSAEFLGVTSL